jgi:hypothetical protein
MVQVAECLHSRHDALASNPSTTKKQTQKNPTTKPNQTKVLHKI